jgi:DNA-binding PadR family transcriptional regulator
MTTRKTETKPETIGHFEQNVLTAIVNLGGETYGAPIYDEVCKITEKRVNMGSLYITLDRMEEKGLLTSRWDTPAKHHRGRPKRFYCLEKAGLNALQHSLEHAKRLSEMLDEKSGSINRWLTKRRNLVHQES